MHAHEAGANTATGPSVPRVLYWQPLGETQPESLFGGTSLKAGRFLRAVRIATYPSHSRATQKPTPASKVPFGAHPVEASCLNSAQP